MLRPPAFASIRRIHASSSLSNLVAPPDPVSHMRPVIYASPPSPQPPLNHPYSLAEFATESNMKSDFEIQYKLQCQQLDDFNHHFWFDTNTRLQAAKQAVLAGLPPSATELDKEQTLSLFFKQWYLQEAGRTEEYTMEWRRRNLALIKLGARVQLNKLLPSFFRSK